METSNTETITPRISGLLPVGVFLVLFIGSGVVLQDFYSMPAIVAFVCALAVAFIQNKSSKASRAAWANQTS